MLKIRRPLGRLIFNMGIAIPGKTIFLIETAPWCCGSHPRPWLSLVDWLSMLIDQPNLGRCDFGFVNTIIFLMILPVMTKLNYGLPCSWMSSAYGYIALNCLSLTINDQWLVNHTLLKYANQLYIFHATFRCEFNHGITWVFSIGWEYIHHLWMNNKYIFQLI